MATKKRPILIRVEPCNYEKFKVIADSNRRSMTNQLEYLMVKFIADYEKQNGAIPLPVELAQNKNAVNVNGDNNVIGNIGDNGVAIMKAF